MPKGLTDNNFGSPKWSYNKVLSDIKTKEYCDIPKCEGFQENEILNYHGRKCDFNVIDSIYSTKNYPISFSMCLPSERNRKEEIFDVDWDTFYKFWNTCHFKDNAMISKTRSSLEREIKFIIFYSALIF